MLKSLSNQAIAAALRADWQSAININLEIVKDNPNHIPTLNRLAKAYGELGQNDEAQSYYQKVLELDRYNSIALKNSQVIKHHQPQKNHPPFNLNLNFIDEPGKTKTLPLTRLGDQKVITSLVPGQIVHLTPKNHSICVTTDNQEHIGALTDDIAYLLKHAINLGNQYEVAIKVATNQKVWIFIRETFRDERLKDSPTFTHSSVI